MTSVSIEYKLLDNFSAGFNSIANATSSFSSYIDQLGTKMFKINQITETFDNLKQTLEGLTAPGVKFQQQMADLQAITGITGKDFDKLNDAAREVGVNSGLGASQASEAFKLLASNIDISTIGGVEGLKKLQKETIVLSQAAGVDMAMAADTMSFAINQFGLSANDASRVINVLGAGAKYGASEIPDLAQSLKIAGTTANQAGISIESTVGALEVLSQNALKGSEAGTGLRNVMLKLQTEGIKGVDLKTMGLSKSLAALKPYLNDTTFLAKTFGAENINAAQILIKNAEAVDNMTAKVTNTSVAYEQAEIRTSTFGHKMQKLTAFFDNLKISIFNATQGVLPVFMGMADGLKMVSSMAPGIILLKDAYTWLAQAENRELIVKKLSWVWDGIVKVSKYAAAAALTVFTGATWAGATATLGLNTAQEALNASFAISPLGWVVLAVGALVASIAIAWNKFEGFREIVMGLWDGFKQVFTNIGNFFKLIFDPIFKAIAAVKEGKWGEAAKQAGLAVYNLSPVGLAANAVKFTLNGDLAQGVGDAYNKGKVKQKDKFNKDVRVLANQKIEEQRNQDVLKNFSASSTISTGSNLAAVMPKGTTSKPTNITINLNNLVEKIEIHAATATEGITDLGEKIKDELLRVLNSANALAIG